MLMLESHESIFEIISELEKLDYAQFEKEQKSIWKCCYVQCHIQGNFTQKEAKDIFEMTINKMECSGKRDLIPKPKLKNINQPICVKVENFNKTDGNR